MGEEEEEEDVEEDVPSIMRKFALSIRIFLFPEVASVY